MYNKSQRRKKSKKFIRKLFENQRYINCLNKKRKERWLNSKWKMRRIFRSCKASLFFKERIR